MQSSQLTKAHYLASTGVLLFGHDSSFLSLCRFSSIWLESCSGRTYRNWSMPPYPAQKILPKKRYPEEEEWEYLEEGFLKKSRSACICMTCQHFNYCCDRHCHTLLTCHVRQRLILHGEHLTSRCPLWMPRREKEIGWCPEAAWYYDSSRLVDRPKSTDPFVVS